MCVVSAIGDDWSRRTPGWPGVIPLPTYVTMVEFETWKANHKIEFDKLKEEFEALKELLKAAKIYDDTTGQPNCEMDEKVALIKKVADLLGVDVSEVFN
jgi:hypothetical protein